MPSRAWSTIYAPRLSATTTNAAALTITVIIIKEGTTVRDTIFILAPTTTDFNSASLCGFTSTKNTATTTNKVMSDTLLIKTVSPASSDWELLTPNGADITDAIKRGWAFNKNGINANSTRYFWVTLNKDASTEFNCICSNSLVTRTIIDGLTISGVSVVNATGIVSFTMNTKLFSYLTNSTYNTFKCTVSNTSNSIESTSVTQDSYNGTINISSLPEGDYSIKYAMYQTRYMSNSVTLNYRPVPILQSITQNTNSLSYTVSFTSSSKNFTGGRFYKSNKTTVLSNPISSITSPTTNTSIYYKTAYNTFSSNAITFTMYPLYSFTGSTSFNTTEFTIGCNAYTGTVGKFVGTPPSNVTVLIVLNTGFKITMGNTVTSGTYKFRIQNAATGEVCFKEIDISYTVTPPPPPVLTSVTQTTNSLAFTSVPSNVTLYLNGSIFTSPISSITVPTDYALSYKNAAGVSSNAVTLTAYPLYTFVDSSIL